MSSKMSKTQNRVRQNPTKKSLALKMNLAMFSQNLNFIFLSQLLMFSLIVSYQTVKIEQNAEALLRNPLVSSRIDEGTQILGYSFLIVDGSEDPQESALLAWMLPIDDAERTWFIPKTDPNWITRLMTSEYQLLVPYRNSNLLIRYPLESNIIQLLQILAILFGIQFLFLLIRIVSNFGLVNDALQPLAQLTDSAVKLQNELSNVSLAKRSSEIEGFAGVLKQLDVTQLDKPVLVQNQQKELDALTNAINDLLIRMKDAYQSQTRFVSDASHELRTPIAIIQGYANLLDRWGKDDPKTAQEAIDAIKDESQHMKNLIEQLLFLARGDSDTLLLQKEAFDVDQLIQSVVKEARLIDSTHPYAFTPTQPTGMFADKQLIKQVLRILLDNASKYSNADEVIRIKVSHENQDVSIMVQDNGVGMKEETIQHVFDRFYRGDTTKDIKAKGTGLGLSIAKSIVEKHDGKFEINSRYGVGTWITVTFKDAYRPIDDLPTNSGEIK